jgi:glycosyltransferase involved in cell wall biosynthesis
MGFPARQPSHPTEGTVVIFVASACATKRRVPKQNAVRVAVDVTPLIGVRTGVGVALADILEAFDAVDDAPVLVPYALSLRARAHRDDLPKNTRFVPVPAAVLLRTWTRLDRPRIDRWLRPAQVLHATNYLAPPSRLPTLVTVYDCSFARHPELCTPEVRAFEPALRRALQRGVTVHTSSEFVADEIEELFGPGLRAAGRIVVVPLGVPRLEHDARLAPALATRLDGARFVLSIGTLEPRKNLPRLVSAFGRVAAGDDDVLLVIAGRDGPARDDVDRALASLDAAARARVVLPGAVDNATRAALLTEASVVAYPSVYEGFGFPVLEAMASGVPVVATNAGAVPEVAGDAALLVDPNDVDALAAAITSVLDDDARRTELVARGRARVTRYSWTATATALSRVYRQLAP